MPTEEQMQRAVAQRTREIAESICPYCAVHERSGLLLLVIDGELYHTQRTGEKVAAYPCKSYKVRRAYPDAFPAVERKEAEKG